VSSQVRRLAELIETDIEQRCMVPGTQYLTAVEAGIRLGVHERMASRAMGFLADKGVLVRRRRAGTFVGPNATQRRPTELKCIYLLLGSRLGVETNTLTGIVVDEIMSEIPNYRIQIDMVAETGDHGSVERVVKEHQEHGNIGGMVLFGCSLATQTAVLTSGVPAVVIGSVYQGTTSLSSVDIDQFEAGRIACRYLLDQGHRRILFLCRDFWLPGDNLRLDGVNAMLAQSGMDHDALIMRSVHGDTDTIKSEVALVLSGKDRSTGVICQHWYFADAALAAHKSLGLNNTGDLDIVVVNRRDSRLPSHLSSLPYVWTEMDFREGARVAAQALKQRIIGDRITAEHTVLPVKLIESRMAGQKGGVCEINAEVVPSPDGEILEDTVRQKKSRTQ
jgi:DNA-binding LacI/PurR family transcriptional regulator